MHKVSFASEGVECAGLLGIPARAEGQRHPALVLGHGFGILKESLIDEAEFLTAAGFLTLAMRSAGRRRAGGGRRA